MRLITERHSELPLLLLHRQDTTDFSQQVSQSRQPFRICTCRMIQYLRYVFHMCSRNLCSEMQLPHITGPINKANCSSLLLPLFPYISIVSPTCALLINHHLLISYIAIKLAFHFPNLISLKISSPFSSLPWISPCFCGSLHFVSLTLYYSNNS